MESGSNMGSGHPMRGGKGYREAGAPKPSSFPSQLFQGLAWGQW